MLPNELVDDRGDRLDLRIARRCVHFLDERIQLLTAMENEAKQAGDTKAFIRQFKDLTKFCFVNSEVGATQAFEFNLVPGRWDAAMDLKPGQKAYPI